MKGRLRANNAKCDEEKEVGREEKRSASEKCECGMARFGWHLFVARRRLLAKCEAQIKFSHISWWGNHLHRQIGEEHASHRTSLQSGVDGKWVSSGANIIRRATRTYKGALALHIGDKTMTGHRTSQDREVRFQMQPCMREFLELRIKRMLIQELSRIHKGGM